MFDSITVVPERVVVRRLPEGAYWLILFNHKGETQANVRAVVYLMHGSREVLMQCTDIQAPMVADLASEDSDIPYRVSTALLKVVPASTLKEYSR
jgi:hypothetical protein